MTSLTKPLFTVMRQFLVIPTHALIGDKLPLLFRSSFMRSVQSFELDDNYILNERRLSIHCVTID